MEKPSIAYAIKTGPGRCLTLVGLWSQTGKWLCVMPLRECQAAFPDLFIVFTTNARMVKPDGRPRQLELFPEMGN
jgi:hypothetical protein